MFKAELFLKILVQFVEKIAFFQLVFLRNLCDEARFLIQKLSYILL